MRLLTLAAISIFTLLILSSCAEKTEENTQKNESENTTSNITEETQNITEEIVEEILPTEVELHLGQTLNTLITSTGAEITLTDSDLNIIRFHERSNTLKGGLVKAEIMNYPEHCGEGCQVNMSVKDINITQLLRCIARGEYRAMINHNDCFDNSYSRKLSKAWKYMQESNICSKTPPTGYVEYGKILPDSGELAWAISMEAEYGQDCTTTCFISSEEITKITYCGINYGEEHERINLT